MCAFVDNNNNNNFGCDTRTTHQRHQYRHTFGFAFNVNDENAVVKTINKITGQQRQSDLSVWALSLLLVYINDCNSNKVCM